MEKRYEIALIVCYFGKLPWYFEYFVYSCKYNPTIDFFVITDDRSYSKEIPRNVKIINKSLNDINALASKKLGFPVNIEYGYKICDFKPSYGFLFSEMLSTYDFWGHIDIDIIFGDIRAFMTGQLLEKFDIISVRHDWLTGCFLLFRNDHKCNMLFSHSKDYKKVFTSNKHYCFDETNFAHGHFTDGKSYTEVDTEIESMMHVVKKLELLGLIRPFFDQYIIEGLPGRLDWQEGKLFYRKRYEVLLYHLIYLKKTYNPTTKSLKITKNFKISPSKIIHYKSQLSS